MIGGSSADASAFGNGLRIAAAACWKAAAAFSSALGRWSMFVGPLAFHIGHGRRQPLIDFDWRWRDDKIGETPCRGSREENARNGKSQADHFFTISPSSTSRPWERAANSLLPSAAQFGSTGGHRRVRPRSTSEKSPDESAPLGTERNGSAGPQTVSNRRLQPTRPQLRRCVSST